VGASSSQRQWIGLSITGDQVIISPIDIPVAEFFLESLDIEFGFWKRTLEIAEQYSADEMAKTFVRAFSDQVFAVNQQIVFDFHGQTLKGLIKGLTVLEMPQEQRRGSHGQSAASLGMGVIMERTDVNILKAPDSKIKIKTSSKKCVNIPYIIALHLIDHS